MSTVIYCIRMYSEWHCSSGLSTGAGDDLLVIRDERGLPFIPGKTLKGLLRDAAEKLSVLNHLPDDFTTTLFGARTESATESSATLGGASTLGVCHFSNAELTGKAKKIAEYNGLHLLYRSRALTSVDQAGLAVNKTLRRQETVVPLTLFARVTGVPKEHRENLENCMRFVKHLGVNRNRGLGRCDLAPSKEVAE